MMYKEGKLFLRTEEQRSPTGEAYWNCWCDTKNASGDLCDECLCYQVALDAYALILAGWFPNRPYP